jgi:glycerol-3-phosphate dehydrogenase (NAD(P)+)
MAHLTILGSGAWGTALAAALQNNFDSITMWSYLKEEADNINTNHQSQFLPGITLGNHVKATTSIAEASKDADLIISAVPSFSISSVWMVAKPVLKKGATLVNVSKGIEQKSQKFPHQIFNEVFAEEVSYFSLVGPSFAEGVAKGAHTGLMLAGKDAQKAQELINKLQTDTFLLKYTDDVVGVELAAVMKNVIAIASGMVIGMGHGPNTQALVVVHGLQEIMKLGKKMGAKEETFKDLAGLGDLLLTAMNKDSRNMSFGHGLGEGKTVEESLKELKGVSEGYQTVQSLNALLEKHQLDLPIMQMMIDILLHNEDPKKGLSTALKKSFKS